jgi:hypothetical protein
MKFTCNDVEYRIVFAHPTKTEIVPSKWDRKITKRYTMVWIFTGERGTPNEIVVTTAVTPLVSFDHFCYDTQRKMALRAALDLPVFRREFRIAAWKAYHERPGGLYQKKKDENVLTSSSIQR